MKRKRGSIDTTAGGRHRVRLSLPDGRRPSLSIHDSEEEAELALEAAIAVMATSGADALTLGEWGEKWLTAREVAGEIRDPGSDWSRWNVHVKSDPIAKYALKNVTRHDARQWLTRVRRKVARQTAINTLNLLRGLMREALERGYVKANVFAGLDVPRQKRTEQPWTYLVPDEQARLLAQFPHPTKHLIAFSIGTGLRAGELCSLRLRDVHTGIANPYMVVRYGTPPALSTKTGRIREVPLMGMALDALDGWLTALPKENPHGLVFPRERGGFRDPKHVIRWDVWSAGVDAAELGRNLRWHDLRHTCASSLVSGYWGRVWSLDEVRDILGHESITTTERYAHIAASALHRAASETPRHGHLTATAQGGDVDGTLGKTPSAPGAIRTRDLRFRKSLLNAEITRTWPFEVQSKAIDFLRAMAKGESAHALTIAAELAEGVLAAAEADAKRGAS